MGEPTIPIATTSDALAGSDLPAGIHETHTGIVVLVGDRAYKAKKPICTDFLDFRSATAREEVCHREVELNRRLAPDSYLGVAHLQLPDGAPPEPVIVMRRYPERRRLRSMIAGGEATDDHLTALADLLADFHRNGRRSPLVDDCARAPRLSKRWQDNLDQLALFSDIISDDGLGEVRRLAMRYIEGRIGLFDDRIKQGRIVDGHGDLLTDDVFCMPEGPVPLDCLEFDDNLRFVDGIDDAAFLAMDLEFNDRDDLATFFLTQYRTAAGDDAPRSLADFYIAYRAIVRAKVDCIRVRQGHNQAEADARRHLEVALEHLRAATVQLVVVGGGPGSGKSTLADALSRALNAEVVSTDAVRRELQGTAAVTGSAGVVNAGLYSAANVATVYDEVLRRAGETLAGGRSVILDATWRDDTQRQRARRVARQNAASVVEISCVTDLFTAQQRITARRSQVSDATPDIAARISGQPWREAHPVDTAGTVTESVAEALRVCRLNI